MIYRKLVTRGEDTIEHIIEGDYEEVLALFTELEAKDAVEYHGMNLVNHKVDIDWNNTQDLRDLEKELYK